MDGACTVESAPLHVDVKVVASVPTGRGEETDDRVNKVCVCVCVCARACRAEDLEVLDVARYSECAADLRGDTLAGWRGRTAPTARTCQNIQHTCFETTSLYMVSLHPCLPACLYARGYFKNLNSLLADSSCRNVGTEITKGA
jgi:hypothetical protein